MTGKPGWFQVWTANNQELVAQVLTILQDPASGKTYVSRDAVLKDLHERGIPINKRFLTQIVRSHPELFTQWSGSHNPRCVTWRRVEA